MAGRRLALVGVTAGWLATVAIAGGVGWWAADATLEPPDVTAPAASPATYEVAEGTIERVFQYTASAEWKSRPLSTNSASGTVTSVDVSPGQSVDVGDVLYTVNERPVVVAEGAVPMYRDLSNGATGSDVEQLQALLRELDYYNSEPSGKFTSGTTYAVKAWQRDLGVDDDGAVTRGDIVFVPELPVRVTLADGIAVGQEISPGAEAVSALAEEPKFAVQLSQEQVELVPLDSNVVVEHDDGEWPAVIETARSVINQAGEEQVELVLTAPPGDDGDAGPVCVDECEDAVPVGDATMFDARVVVIPETSGPVVPAAALRTGADGAVSVVTADGEQQPVELLARDSGQAVVDGLDVGTEVLVFGGDEASTDANSGTGDVDEGGEDG